MAAKREFVVTVIREVTTWETGEVRVEATSERAAKRLVLAGLKDGSINPEDGWSADYDASADETGEFGVVLVEELES